MQNMTTHMIELCKHTKDGVLYGNCDALKKLGIEIEPKKHKINKQINLNSIYSQKKEVNQYEVRKNRNISRTNIANSRRKKRFTKI